MPYTEFSLERLKRQFGIDNRVAPLFAEVNPIEPSEQLRVELERAKTMRLRSEKAKSEWLVVPVLRELLWRNEDFFTIFSGENLDADPATGLNGECDFILAKKSETYTISYPIIQVVEAKKNDFDLGIPQCAAQLLGAKRYNQSWNTPVDTLYGCVTTGDRWQFIRYNAHLTIDNRFYTLDDTGSLLGVLQQIVDYYKVILA